MSPHAQTENANNTPRKRASKNRSCKSRRRASPKWRGLEMALKRARSRRASSKILSLEEITADLNRLKAEMAERKPQRDSSERENIKKRLATMQRLERDIAARRGRNRSVTEYQNNMLKVLDEVAMRLVNEGHNPLPATALLVHRIQDHIGGGGGGAGFSGQLKI